MVMTQQQLCSGYALLCGGQTTSNTQHKHASVPSDRMQQGKHTSTMVKCIASIVTALHNQPMRLHTN